MLALPIHTLPFELIISLFFQICALWTMSSVVAKSKYYDGEVRPYKFGFEIKESQDRREQKGNIMLTGLKL